MDQMYRVESPIQKYGQVPRNKLVNPPLSELHSLVEEGWLALDSGYIPPDEERLPLASLLDIRVELSPLECGRYWGYPVSILRRSRGSRLRLPLLMLIAAGQRCW